MYKIGLDILSPCHLRHTSLMINDYHTSLLHEEI